MQPVMQLETLQARAQQLARTLELEMRRRMEQILLEAPQATSVSKLLVLAPPLIVARMPVMQPQLTPLASLMALMQFLLIWPTLPMQAPRHQLETPLLMLELDRPPRLARIQLPDLRQPVRRLPEL